jgi:hypothetical protein
VRIDPPFHVLQYFFPGIHSLRVLVVDVLQVQPAAEESKKSPSQLFPQLWKNCGKTQPLKPHAAAVSFWVDPVTFSPSSDWPNMILPLGPLTSSSRHGVHRCASCDTGLPKTSVDSR